MTGYELHPEARRDLDEIWEYIALDNINAADKVVAKILKAITGLVPFPHQGQQAHRSNVPPAALPASV